MSGRSRVSGLAAIVSAFLMAVGAAGPPIDEPEFTTVFVSGEVGYELIRTPQILVTREGTLLVFAQGREGHHDQSGNDIIVKRSVDGGRSWSPPAVIAEDGPNSLNSVCVLQLRPSGRILLVGCVIPAGHNIQDYRYASSGMQEYMRRNNRHELPALRPGYGEGSTRVYVISSDDDGATWTKMLDVTRSTKRPQDALTCIPGPGLGIQLSHGEHAGRVLIPVNQLWLQEREGRLSYRNLPYALLSDDEGWSWRWGKLAEPAEANRGLAANETQFVELAGGAVMLNARSTGRVVAASRDGGKSWSPLVEEPALVGPACAAGLIRYSWPDDGQKSRILFSLPGNPDRRESGTVWLSYDEGKSWPVSKVLRSGRFAYSCLARLPDDRVGCVFGGREQVEEAGTRQVKNVVVLATFTLGWLTDGRDNAGR